MPFLIIYMLFKSLAQASGLCIYCSMFFLSFELCRHNFFGGEAHVRFVENAFPTEQRLNL